jgi:cytochrome c551/c552
MRTASIFSLLLATIFVLGCGEKRAERRYDAKALLQQKCAHCHNLDMPPKTYENETAPPIMAVTFHIKDFMKVDNPAEKRPRFIAFVADYALHPAADKSFCDKASLASYGLMPSLEGNITKPELEAVAAYLYDTYTKEAFLKRMQEANAFALLPKGEQLARKKGCFSCHDMQRQKIGPTFPAVAARYRNADVIARSIRDGSRGKWEASRNIPMPAMKELNATQLTLLSDWIVHLNE